LGLLFFVDYNKFNLYDFVSILKASLAIELINFTSEVARSEICDTLPPIRIHSYIQRTCIQLSLRNCFVNLKRISTFR